MVTADDGSSGKFAVFSQYTCQSYPYTFFINVYTCIYTIVTRSENYDQSAHRKRKHYIP